eukprot:TRINITY_DN533_c0_g2_i1.p1 TRINITY_DN533_c0_g2~~TRINITY_DN533_c0_g2_i1.p1  ORF type:complete len:788 (+),score=192.47 TRINITY_DN533_c0_g2_i1:58-2421(+)
MSSVACLAAAGLPASELTLVIEGKHEALQVNGAPAVQCTVCERPVAMKDWAAHVVGKKHKAAAEGLGLSPEEILEMDRKVKETIPAVHPSLRQPTQVPTPKSSNSDTPKAAQPVYVNGVAAVLCRVCDRQIAMKDWKAHISGQKHCSSTKYSEARRRELDEETTSSLPDVFTWGAPNCGAHAGYVTSSTSVTSNRTVVMGDTALCGDILTASAVPYAWVGCDVTFDIRLCGPRTVAYNVRKVGDAVKTYIKQPEEKLQKLCDVPPTDSLEIRKTTAIDGLTLSYVVRLEKVGATVKYTRGGVVRWLESGFSFDYSKYCLRSRCGAFSHSFVLSDPTQQQSLSALRAFINSVDGGRWAVVPDVALLISAKDTNSFDDLFCEVKCPHVLEKLRAAWISAAPFERVWRVCNDKLEASFEQMHARLSKEQQGYCDVAWGFHGTAEDNITKIATNGFDPSKRKGQAHGVGEYFAVHPSTSMSYCVGGRYMFYCKLLVGTSQHSNYVQGCRYHVINTQKNTVMALPMYVIKFHSAPMPLRPWQEKLESAGYGESRAAVMLRPIVTGESTMLAMGRVYDKVRLKGVSCGAVHDVVELVENCLKVKVEVGCSVLGYQDVVIEGRMSGKQLVGLRDMVHDKLVQATGVVVAQKTAEESPGYSWKRAVQNGSYFEILIKAAAEFDVAKKYHSAGRLKVYTELLDNLRGCYPRSIVDEDSVWMTAPLSPPDLEAFLQGSLSATKVSSLTFSHTNAYRHPYKDTTVAILCNVITIRGSTSPRVEHQDAILPLFGVFPKK